MIPLYDWMDVVYGFAAGFATAAFAVTWISNL